MDGERSKEDVSICEVGMEGEGDIEKETLRGKRGRTKETGIARGKIKRMMSEREVGREREGGGREKESKRWKRRECRDI